VGEQPPLLAILIPTARCNSLAGSSRISGFRNTRLACVVMNIPVFISVFDYYFEQEIGLFVQRWVLISKVNIVCSDV
jgi:hypothetical protein